jgi:hypothetical protein
VNPSVDGNVLMRSRCDPRTDMFCEAHLAP